MSVAYSKAFGIPALGDISLLGDNRYRKVALAVYQHVHIGSLLF